MSLNAATQDIFNIIVRLCGLILLFIGMWIAVQVFGEAIALYKNPANIERMATAIEAGSNIDKSLLPIRDKIISGEDETGQSRQQATRNEFRLSYFIAWVIGLLLLLLLARIAVMAVKTGGELALYDVQIKQLAKHIVKADKKE